MWRVSSIHKFYACRWGGGRKFKVKKLLTFVCTLHACVAHRMHAWCTKSCTLCNGWDVFEVQNSSLDICLYSQVPVMSRQDTTWLPECTCYSGSVPHAVYWNCDWAVLCVAQLQFCCKLLVSLYSMAVDQLTAVSLAGQCCTQRLELLVSLFRASRRS